MTTVKLMGALPGGDNNGAAAIGADLVRMPRRLHPMIAIVDCRRVTTDADTGEQTATARVRRIEALLPDDMPAAERLLRRALEKRTGATVLPLELEDEITAAFSQTSFDDLAAELAGQGDGDGDGELDEGGEPDEDEGGADPDPDGADDEGDRETGE